MIAKQLAERSGQGNAESAPNRSGCLRCGEPFPPQRHGGPRRRYCSDRCRNLATIERGRAGQPLSRKHPSRGAPCAGCGAWVPLTVFAGHGRNQNTKQNRYCGPACLARARVSGVNPRSLIELPCAVCGQVVPPNEDGVRPLCCSGACANRYLVFGAACLPEGCESLNEAREDFLVRREIPLSRIWGECVPALRAAQGLPPHTPELAAELLAGGHLLTLLERLRAERAGEEEFS